MADLKWEQVCTEFEVDGSLRDIYILQTDTHVWQRVIEVIRSEGYRLEFFCDDKPMPFPAEVNTVFRLRESSSCLLKIYVATIQLNCHFFGDGEIEFDLDPREIMGQVQLELLFHFMRLLANSVDASVSLTPENLSSHPIFTVQPGCCEIHYDPFYPL